MLKKLGVDVVKEVAVLVKANPRTIAFELPDDPTLRLERRLFPSVKSKDMLAEVEVVVKYYGCS